MNRIYISDHGDDKNDGRTRETAIYSCTRETAIYSSKRAIKHCAVARRRTFTFPAKAGPVKASARVTARIEIKVFMAASPLRWNLAHD